MSENSKKQTNQARRYNPIVVEMISEKYGISKHYVRQCLRGDRNSLTSDTIRKVYQEKTKKLEEQKQDYLNSI